MNIKLDSDTISSINVFSDVTGVMPRDCIKKDDQIIFVVSQGQAGLSIGKNGTKMKILQKMFGKDIIVIEYSDDPLKFLANIMRPNRLVSGYVANADSNAKVEASINGKISAPRLKLAKTLLQRYFNIININIR